MYSNTARLPLPHHHHNQHLIDECRKENLYLDRIARLMDTDRTTLTSYGKIKLWEDGTNYQKVVKYVDNSQCHSNVKLTVVNIHRVWCRKGKADLFEISNRKLLWHGTKRANIPNILNNGFRLPAHNGQMFGAGIYFADRITKSSNYSDSDVTFLLLCEVGLGKVYSCKSSHNGWLQAPLGFDSTKANGEYVPDWTVNGKYFGADIPFGKTAKCTKYTQHAVKFNEFIVYDPNRIIIRFLVEVKVEQVWNSTSLVLVTPRHMSQKSNFKKSLETKRANKDKQALRNRNLKGKTVSSVPLSKNVIGSISATPTQPRSLTNSTVHRNGSTHYSSSLTPAQPRTSTNSCIYNTGSTHYSSPLTSAQPRTSTNSSIYNTGSTHYSSPLTSVQPRTSTNSSIYNTGSTRYSSPLTSVQPYSSNVQRKSGTSCVIL